MRLHLLDPRQQRRVELGEQAAQLLLLHGRPRLGRRPPAAHVLHMLGDAMVGGTAAGAGQEWCLLWRRDSSTGLRDRGSAPLGAGCAGKQTRQKAWREEGRAERRRQLQDGLQGLQCSSAPEVDRVHAPKVDHHHLDQVLRRGSVCGAIGRHARAGT